VRGVWRKDYRITMPGPALVGEFAAWMREPLLDGDLAIPGPTKKHREVLKGDRLPIYVPLTGGSGLARVREHVKYTL